MHDDINKCDKDIDIKDSGIKDVSFGKDITLVAPLNLYGCTLGDGVFVGPFVEIQRGASIGEGTRVQSHSFIPEGVSIGRRCFIGHGVMFVNDLFKDGTLASHDALLKTTLGDDIYIGSNATILPVSICSHVVIGAGAVVCKDIEISGSYAGNPARLLTRFNEASFEIDRAADTKEIDGAEGAESIEDGEKAGDTGDINSAKNIKDGKDAKDASALDAKPLDDKSAPFDFALVGAGYFGRLLLQNAASIGCFGLGFYDPLSIDIPLPRAASFEALLASDVKALIIASPSHLHFRQARAALLANKHVFVEKPLALSYKEAEELCFLAKRRGLALHCDFEFAYSRKFQALLSLLGDEIPLYIRAARQNLNRTQLDIDIFYDLVVHDLALLRMLLDSCYKDMHAPLQGLGVSAQNIGANSPLETRVTASVRGIELSLEASYTSYEKIRVFEVFTRTRHLVYDDANGVFYSSYDAKDGRLFGQKRLAIEDAPSLQSSLYRFAMKIKDPRAIDDTDLYLAIARDLEAIARGRFVLN